MSGLDWLIARPVAHRGLHDAARRVMENTPSAFAAAVAANYAIECDLQITADGEAMVHHDDVLGRLTDGTGRLDGMTSAQLRQVRFKTTTDRMISLGELCDLVAGRATLVIELKCGRSGDDRLAARTAAVLSGYAGSAALMSFDPAQIAPLRRHAPHLTRGLVAEGPSSRASAEDWVKGLRHTLGYVQEGIEARPQFLAYAVEDLPGVLPRMAHLCGMPVLTWTVRNAQQERRAARWADQMIFEGFRP